MITYIKGDATQPANSTIIVHICNNVGSWGAGFVIALSNRFGTGPESPQVSYLKRVTTTGRRLGNVDMVPVAVGEVQKCYVANMICQNNKNLGRVRGQDKISYAALTECIKKVNAFAKLHGCSIQMPRIGCGIAGSNWEKMLPYIELFTAPVTVIDL